MYFQKIFVSLADLSKQYRITMETNIEKCITVHLNQQKVKFCQLPGGLYACNPKLSEKEKEDKINFDAQSNITVKNNSKFVSNRQLQKAQSVKCLQNACGMPLHADLKAIITMNMIQDNTQ